MTYPAIRLTDVDFTDDDSVRAVEYRRAQVAVCRNESHEVAFSIDEIHIFLSIRILVGRVDGNLNPVVGRFEFFEREVGLLGDEIDLSGERLAIDSCFEVAVVGHPPLVIA